ncbi:MAG TPA: phosphonoacetaldehyde hydrolase [Chloroflexota bacterium]|nr:phosphonoacetaldehyde hydrolase [Chloroflexota bacterium]
MEFVFRRGYRGRLKAVILDWAGTTVDYGSRAPVAAFREVFKRRNVDITVEQSRRPMGLGKRDHIRAVVAIDEVSQLWQTVHGRPCDESDIAAMYEDFLPLQRACVVDYAEPIPGTQETVSEFRARRLRIGSTTGYSTKIMEVLVPVARTLGYEPDIYVCPDQVSTGRPDPWMCFQNAMAFGVYPMESCVKIGDTVHDVEEGLNAGMWTIAVVKSGNEIGLSEEEIRSLGPSVLEAKIWAAADRLRHAGAHFVVKTIANTPAVLDEIESRLRCGDRP